MLFNSLEYLIFLPAVFLLYWFIFSKTIQRRNLFLLFVSYVFYGWWDWRFLGLIAVSSWMDYWCGLRLGEALSKKHEAGSRVNHPKFYLGLSFLFNLGLLGFFKYYNFFIETAAQAIQSIGMQPHIHTLNIILPVGISFYTFQTLSYTIDVYRGRIQPKKDPVAFLAFVSFFPQLVAGPIERASNLLPQFFERKSFKYSLAMDGMRQILWGLFMKVVIADNCAVFVDQAFTNPESQPGSNLLVGAVFFSLQIYGDFGGYSNIAIGSGKLLGFDLMRNFAFPYFSRDIAEFWRRWHISLSTWFRDYLYIPLGGSKGSKLVSLRNIFIIFLVSGFWHGANWTFVVWGGIHAALFIPLFIWEKNRVHLDIVALNRMLPSFYEFNKMLLTFSMVTLAWIFFRAQNIGEALVYLDRLFSTTIWSKQQMDIRLYLFMGLSICFMSIEWMGRREEFAIQRMAFQQPALIRYGMYYGLVIAVFLFARKEQEFIYFQF